MNTLNVISARSLPASVARPQYDRDRVTTGVVHLGLGAFHKAHQAVIYDDALNEGDLRWGVLGASLRSSAVRNQLTPQDNFYTLTERTGGNQRTRLIGALQGVLAGPADPGALVRAMAQPQIDLVTLTITEKGYKRDPTTGSLIAADRDVAADLASLDRPQTAPGFVVAALARRRAAGIKPFTAISCDNLPHNGERLRGAVLELAEHHDKSLRDWIDTDGAFPSTMVDRIVPATEEADIIDLQARIGAIDRAMVKTEPFTQWIIENRFAGERPDFAALGVQLTDAVAPWETAKLRLLNGAHSAIAYLGGLAGVEFVHEFLGIPAGRSFIESLWNESETTLSPPPGMDLAGYRAALLQRFANSALNHHTRQIAVDGSQKLPQRLLDPIHVRLQRHQSIDALALAVAAWMRWQEGRDDNGAAYVVDDPLAARTKVAGGLPAEEAVAALLAVETIFPLALAASNEFHKTLANALQALREKGARTVLRERFGQE